MGGDHERHVPARRRPARRRHLLRASATTCGAPSGWRPCRKTKVIYFWTHDSVGLGEDGPTHQPVEQLAAMRAMPEPAGDPPGRRQRDGPGRQGGHRPRRRPDRPDPHAARQSRCWTARPSGAERLHRGAYVLVGGRDDPDIVLIGTGSEVSVCVDAAKLLAADGLARPGGVHAELGAVRASRTTTTRTRSSGSGAPVLSVEAAATFGWSRWADDSVSLDHFGASGPGAEVLAALRLHRRQRGRPGPGPARRNDLIDDRGGKQMTRLHRALHRGRPEPLDRQPVTPTAIRSGRLARAGRRGHPGGDLEPDHLPKGHDRLGRLRRAVRPPARPSGSVEQAFWDMAIDDVTAALRDTPTRSTTHSGGADGFVSLEVSPAPGLRHRRHHRGGPAPARAHRHAQPAGQDPGHRAAGVPAIRQMISEGRNINVTLIFSLDALRRGHRGLPVRLEALGGAGGDLSRVHSVASFFVSRVDTEVDRRLEAIGDEAAARPAGQGRGGPGQAGLPAVPRALLRAPLGGPGGQGRPPPATAVGVDLDQEPGLPGPAVRRQPDRPGHGQHHAGRHRGRLRRPRHGGPHRRPRTSTQARADLDAAAARPGVDMADVSARARGRRGGGLLQELRRAAPGARRQGQRAQGTMRGAERKASQQP